MALFVFRNSSIQKRAQKFFPCKQGFQESCVEINISYITSTLQTGLFVDNKLLANQTVRNVYNELNPRMTPTDPNSERVPMVFDRTTGNLAHHVK